eukprot:6199233-Pleurochrysis_carterae.AAC.4
MSNATGQIMSKLLADLTGKAIIVTGSTGGLGKEIARTCIEAKARGILITGRTTEKCERVVDELKETGGNTQIEFVAADLTDADGYKAIVDKAVSAFGTVEGLVNSAALSFPKGDLETTTLEHWDRLLRANLTSAFLLTQYVTRHMKETSTKGSIVNIGSNQSYGGAPDKLACALPPSASSCALKNCCKIQLVAESRAEAGRSRPGHAVSKGGMRVLTKNCAQQLRKANIRVNQLNMGWCLTEAEDREQKKEKGDNWAEQADKESPMGRLLRPIDTAATVIHFLSDASVMITGTELDISPDVILGMLPENVG